jgi:hypothetical protein
VTLQRAGPESAPRTISIAADTAGHRHTPKGLAPCLRCRGFSEAPSSAFRVGCSLANTILVVLGGGASHRQPALFVALTTDQR